MFRSFLGQYLPLAILPLFFLALFSADANAAVDNSPSQSVSDSLEYLLKTAQQKQRAVDMEKLAPLLEFALNASSMGDEAQKVKSLSHGEGIVLHKNIHASMNKMLSYAFNPQVPAELVYPNVIRRGHWLPGSEILNLTVPIEKLFGSKNAPLLLYGKEFEVITPDSNSGSYYEYTLNRCLLAFDEQGKKVLISIAWQAAPSSVGKKAFILSEDNNWNYVYSNEEGTNLSGIGWAEPIMYDSCTVSVYYEKQAAQSPIGCTVFKWVNAGWGGINMVKKEHLVAGTNRFFTGFNEILASSRTPSPAKMIAEKQRLSALTRDERLVEFFPYARYVGEVASTNPPNGNYSNMFKNQSYAELLSDDDLISQMLKNYLRKEMNKTDVLEMPSKQEVDEAAWATASKNASSLPN